MRKMAMTAAAAWLAIVPAAAFSTPGGEPGPGGVQKTSGFVCPVIKTENVLNSPKGMPISEGHYTIAGPHDRSVPIHATNQDGLGDPMGEHAAPGEEDYTAIWNEGC
jgi:hypothetical protein